jgi:hypothetical protein
MADAARRPNVSVYRSLCLVAAPCTTSCVCEWSHCMSKVLATLGDVVLMPVGLKWRPPPGPTRPVRHWSSRT